MLKLLPNQLIGSEFGHQRFDAKASHSTTIEDILKPEYWGHISERLKLGDEIRLISEDFSFRAELIVVQPPTKNQAVVRLLSYTDLAAPAVAQRTETAKATEKAAPSTSTPEGYAVKWRAAAKHSIIRLTDNTVVQSGFATKAEAEAWLADNFGSLSADAA